MENLLMKKVYFEFNFPDFYYDKVKLKESGKLKDEWNKPLDWQGEIKLFLEYLNWLIPFEQVRLPGNKWQYISDHFTVKGKTLKPDNLAKSFYNVDKNWESSEFKKLKKELEDNRKLLKQKQKLQKIKHRQEGEKSPALPTSDCPDCEVHFEKKRYYLKNDDEYQRKMDDFKKKLRTLKKMMNEVIKEDNRKFATDFSKVNLLFNEMEQVKKQFIENGPRVHIVIGVDKSFILKRKKKVDKFY